jgi:hypothetical protein
MVETLMMADVIAVDGKTAFARIVFTEGSGKSTCVQ